MNDKYLQYYSNFQTVNMLIRPKISPDMSKEDILASIHAGAEKVAELKAWNDRFLNEAIYNRDPTALTEEEKADLIELADKLYQNGRGLDMGVAYRIHNLLDSYAVIKGDLDLHIRELYYQGLVLNAFHLARAGMGINLQGELIYRYFCDGASYIKDYEKFGSEETRAFILRCLGNRKFGCPEIKGSNDWQNVYDYSLGYPRYMKIFDETMAVFQSEKYQKMNPNLPWTTYQYAMHFDRTTYLQAAREDKLKINMPELYNYIVKGVLESAEYVYRHQEHTAKIKNQAVAARTQYVYAAARYHAGIIGSSELLDVLYSCINGTGEDDYSSEGVVRNLNMPVYYKAYYDVSSPELQEELKPRVREIMNRVYRYLANYPSNDSINPMLTRITGELTRERVTRDKDFRNKMMNYLLICHAPTCVHSRMVAILSKAMAEQLIKTNPAALVKTLGIETEDEVVECGKEIVSRAYQCGLYHDLGKSEVLNYITVYGRRLLNEEFEAIKYHPVMSSYILRFYEDLNTEAEVALRHHQFYNEKGGYPNDCPACPPDVKMLVNIVTVADSMDAATDNIGRSYAASKQFSTLIQELRDGSGVRYCPEVVGLFDNGEFYAELEHMLNENRHEVYYSTYRSIDGNEAEKLISSEV